MSAFVNRMEKLAGENGWAISFRPLAYPADGVLCYCCVEDYDTYRAMVRTVNRLRCVHVEAEIKPGPGFEGFVRVIPMEDYTAWKKWEADRTERVEAFWQKIHECLEAGMSRSEAVAIAAPLGLQ